MPIGRPREPSEAAQVLLGEALGSASPSMGFARAVLVQIARAPGAVYDPDREIAVARQIAMLLSAPAESDRSPAAVLAAEPILLAAFFQNVDLLYDARDPHADLVSGWIMDALERVGEGS